MNNKRFEIGQVPHPENAVLVENEQPMNDLNQIASHMSVRI